MHHTQKLALPITQAVTMRIDAFIQAAGITPVTPRWLLHLTPEQGDLAHTTTTLLLQWGCPASAGEPSWQLLSITDASSWPDMQRPFAELYVDVEQHHYWYCQGGPLTPAHFTAVFAQWQTRFLTHHPVELTRADAEALAPAIASPHTAD